MHLEEMFVTLRGEPYLLWRAVERTWRRARHPAAEAARDKAAAKRAGNTIYIEAAWNQLRTKGSAVTDAEVARLLLLLHEHINMLVQYSFTVPDAVAKGELRPLRDPADTDS